LEIKRLFIIIEINKIKDGRCMYERRGRRIDTGRGIIVSAMMVDTEELWPQGTQQGQEEQFGRSQKRQVTDCESDIGNRLCTSGVAGLNRSGCYWETLSGAIGLGKKKRR
jgi:hypothetical protein